MEQKRLDYFHHYYELYCKRNKKSREMSREHWERVHAENMKSGKLDMIFFSAEMLAVIQFADENMEKAG